MAQWNVKKSTLLILGFVTVVMLVIVVLPDVDLLDTAFHRGTAPLVVHALANAAPAAVTVASIFQLPPAEDAPRPVHAPMGLAANNDPNFRPILFRSIRR
jgi:hypothetical protein